MEPDMKVLIAERAQVKAALTRFHKFFDGVNDSTSIDIIESRLAKSVNLIDKFETIQNKIEFLIDPNDIDEVSKNEDERERFENIYHTIISKVRRHIKNAQQESIEQSNAQSNRNSERSPVISEVAPAIKLPTLTLPTFNGERDQWVRFRESYESLIHFNDSLSNIQKFHYLNSSISGTAARAIRSLGISDTNYLSAWQALKKRYEDSDSLIDHHTKALFELPTLCKPSFIALRQLVDDATNHLAALRALGEPTEHWDTLLLRLISMKLDNQTKNEWKRHCQSIKKKRKFADIINFLEQHSILLEDSASEFRPQQARSQQNTQHNSSHKRSPNTTSMVVNLDSVCPLCKGNHRLPNCEEFGKLSLSARRSKTLKLRVCFNCLESGHTNRDCTRSYCRKCGKNHHTLVHLDYHSSPIEKSQKGPVAPAKQAENHTDAPQALFSHSSSTANQLVLLSTAIVHIRDAQGNKHECRALLDQGSQANFITENLAKKLGLSLESVNTFISGIGRTSHAIHGKVDVLLSSRINGFKKSISCLVIPKISESIPNFPINKAAIPIPSKFALADPQFSTPSEVDLLIGNGLFWELICIGQHRLGRGFPIMQKTHFGWILAGELDLFHIKEKQSVMCHLATNNELNNALQNFWEIEEIAFPNSEMLTLNSSDPCEIHFSKTTTRNSDGRFVVSIPFTEQLGELGESRHIAEKRLYSMERKFERMPDLKEEYVKFMSEYENLGHMSEVTSERIRDGRAAYYLPHHAVFKISSTTTKLRVVFDGSAKTSTGISLNQVQHVGPIVQDDLFSIVLRLRKNKFVLSGDIAKMYRQVEIKPEHWPFQRILWRRNSSEAIKTFELRTVTYGTASASFLATRALRQLGEESLGEFPLAGQAIIRDFYVDDLLTGTDTLEEAQHLKKTITNILLGAGFELRKWASNDPRILEHANTQANVTIDADKDPKTLGLLWSPEEDCLRYSVQPSSQQKISKRSILSEIAQIFDPLGLVGPAIIQAKILMQRLWELNISWDESLPLHLHTQWQTFRDELTSLNDLRIPRPAIGSNAIHVQLHGFCDASEKAYGASIYLRSYDNQGIATCRLLCAKSRVAPLKIISLPRLELCGALLLTKLIAKIRSALCLKIQSEHYWTDSMIVLSWIKESPSKWRTFVANRVTKIQERTKGEWRHVSSQDNPADIISRGISPSSLATASIWWHGPTWLCQQPIHWPHSTIEVDELPEGRVPTVAMIALTTMDTSIFDRFSCAKKLFRVVAYCFRFHNLLRSRLLIRKSGTNIINGAAESKFDSTILTVDELHHSEKALIQLCQKQCFALERQQLLEGQPISKKSHLLSLHPFMDKSGLLRVGGRLRNAPIPYEQQHPLILPANHSFTKLLIKQEHYRLLHAGCHAVMASLRNKYWPLSCKNTVKGVLRSCVRCFRVKPRGVRYLMGELPADRVTPSRPFATCGLDYAGPFLIKEHSRSRTAIKAYLCVFVCFSTKAVHLELATDMSTDAFLNCFRRFIARRGRCHRIYSDNGSNFIGARNELHELGILLADKLHNIKIHKFLSAEQIEWLLIPPGSPNFGGLWESAVKSAKYHLKRVIGETRLTYEELYTILTQVESCMNSRPLCAISNDPNDHSALTPGHFLIGTAMTTLPHPDLREVKLNRLTRFQLLQQILQHFWARWQSEYLHQLQQRYKWQCSNPINFGPGTLVTIREENTPPLRWRLGRITALHPGKDNVTRVVSIQTAGGVIKRPVSKICLLPCDNSDSA